MLPSGKAPAEESRFVQTCNRLSLFLKEKGKIGNLNFAKFDATTATPPPATVDLLGNICGEKSAAAAEDCLLLPQYVILDSSSNCEVVEEDEGKSAQMTIFYQGQVMVLDDVPAGRARYLMLMAKKGKGAAAAAESSGGSKAKELAAAADLQQAKESSDLPIARRASLHKFLAKRKDRATVRSGGAPYQSQSPSPRGGSAASSGGNEPSFSFDLNM